MAGNCFPKHLKAKVVFKALETIFSSPQSNQYYTCVDQRTEFLSSGRGLAIDIIIQMS